MIKGLMGSKGVNVLGGNTSLQYVNQSISNPMQGMIRVWGTDMQVFDGNGWSNIQSSYATVELDADSQSLLEWARNKRSEELQHKNLADKHPAVKIALENLVKAKEQLDVTIILSEEYEQTTS